MNQGIKNAALRKALVAVLWLALWQLVYWAVGKEILVVSPMTVMLRMGELLVSPDFWRSAAMSLGRIMAGYAAAVAAGTGLAVLTHRFTFARDFFSPALGVIRATPVSSFIILALVWLRSNTIPVFTTFLMVLPIVWSNVAQGIDRTDGNLLEMARAFRVSRAKRLARVYVPSVMPYFIAAATTSIGLAWKAGIAAEVLCTPRFSIGAALLNAKVYLQTADLFAWTAVVIVLSLLLERALVAALRRTGRRYNVAQAEGGTLHGR